MCKTFERAIECSVSECMCVCICMMWREKKRERESTIFGPDTKTPGTEWAISYVYVCVASSRDIHDLPRKPLAVAGMLLLLFHIPLARHWIINTICYREFMEQTLAHLFSPLVSHLNYIALSWCGKILIFMMYTIFKMRIKRDFRTKWSTVYVCVYVDN